MFSGLVLDAIENDGGFNLLMVTDPVGILTGLSTIALRRSTLVNGWVHCS